MRKSRNATLITILAVIFAAVAPGLASAARIDGTLIKPDGMPAAGYKLHLIDSDGKAVARATARDDGTYAFKRLPADAYSLGVENPQGLMAPVVAAPLRVDDDDHAQIDVKLMQAGADAAGGAHGNYSLGLWWAGLSTAAKVWTVVGALTVVGITVSALDDEDDPSPF